jgi:archaellum component FlaG (FlaF/FlaG flagellin family)
MAGMALAKTRHPRPKRVGKNSTLGEKTAVRTHSVLASIFGGRTVLKLIGVIAAAVIITSGVLWYKFVYTDPGKVFWGMVNNNLITPSVTKEIHQSGSSTTNIEDTQLALTPTVKVRDIKEISSTSGTASTKIKIESVGTPTDTYQHYVLIEQPPKSGKAKADYSKVYPLWIKNSGTDQHETQLFNGVVYDAVLFGNMQSSQRTKLTSYLRDAYHVDYGSVQKVSAHGHKTYTYKVKVNLRNFSKAVNYYAKTLGLPNGGKLNPNNYKPTDEVALRMNVDVASKQLKQLEYISSQTIESYVTYGVSANFQEPTHTVSYDALQKSVQKAANQ